MTPDADLHRAAVVAAGFAFASAATTAYWTLGGTALLDTVGGYAEEFARTRGPLPIIGLLIVAVKVMGGLVALGLAHLGLGRKLHRPLLGHHRHSLRLTIRSVFGTFGCLAVAGNTRVASQYETQREPTGGRRSHP